MVLKLVCSPSVLEKWVYETGDTLLLASAFPCPSWHESWGWPGSRLWLWGAMHPQLQDKAYVLSCTVEAVLWGDLGPIRAFFYALEIWMPAILLSAKWRNNTGREDSFKHYYLKVWRIFFLTCTLEHLVWIAKLDANLLGTYLACPP